MKLPFSQPDPAGSERAKKSKFVRDLAIEVSRLRPQALTRTNNEEADHGPTFPANFTKGLKHNSHGLLANPSHYHDFVEAINSTDSTLFEKHVQGASDCGVEYACQPLGKAMQPELDKKGNVKKAQWRGWESPRAGHVYELQGPDAGAACRLQRAGRRDGRGLRPGVAARCPLHLDLHRRRHQEMRLGPRRRRG